MQGLAMEDGGAKSSAATEGVDVIIDFQARVKKGSIIKSFGKQGEWGGVGAFAQLICSSHGLSSNFT